MNDFLSNLLAQLVERVFRNKVTTVAGILGATATALGAFTSLFPEKYAPYVVAAGAILSGVTAALAKDSK